MAARVPPGVGLECPRRTHAIRRRLLLALALGPGLACALSAPLLRGGWEAPARRADDWARHGRTPHETRFSPLDQIHAGNVGRLGLAWSHDFGTARGLEATPLVVDGVLYTTGTWSTVHAFDAASGAPRWSFDPEVPRAIARIVCCDVVNRGPAYHAGRIFVGALDGRLIALDADSGRPLWSVQTTNPEEPYTLTGAPRIAGGRVVIGNSGADLGVRGYVSAYDPDDGALLWRTYTVPGNPADGFESPALERAARTWVGRWWEHGGGGTVWDSLAYDPELGLLYVGTGNGGPWSRDLRSPGGGDNLYLSSILALDVRDGRLVWHYQTTPGDSWDFTATQHMVLTELVLEGRRRRVLLQAPKNGFFYVLDRASGELLSAEPYVEVTWADGVDPRTGRPRERPGVRATDRPVLMRPSSSGGHNWHPMAFHPGTGLVYIPAQEMPGLYTVDPTYRRVGRGHNTGLHMAMYRGLPPPGAGGAVVSGHLLAWDPVAQREVWRAEYGAANNGGVLATAGNLVFQGTADGRFLAYRAEDGAVLFEHPAPTGIVAAPITYRVDGVQYVAVMAGWGGSFALAAGDAAAEAGVRGAGHLLVFALEGAAPSPAPPPAPARMRPRFEVAAGAEALGRGAERYHQWCAVCHGIGAVGGGVLPDLRYAPDAVQRTFGEIVLGGIRADHGMPSFADVLSAEEVRWIQAYVLSRLPPVPAGP